MVNFEKGGSSMRREEDREDLGGGQGGFRGGINEVRGTSEGPE